MSNTSTETKKPQEQTSARRSAKADKHERDGRQTRRARTVVPEQEKYKRGQWVAPLLLALTAALSLYMWINS